MTRGLLLSVFACCVLNAAAGSKLEENLELSNICHHHPAGCVSIPDTCLGNCLGKPNASRDELLKLKSSLIFFDASKFTRHETSSYVNPTKRPLVILDDRLYQMKLYGDEILYLQPFHSRDVEWHDGVPVVKELIDKSAKYASKVANLFKSRGNGNVELQFMEIGKAPKSQMLYRSIHEGNERRGGIADSILIKSTKQTEPLSRNGEIGRRVRRSATNKKQTLESYIRDYYDLEKCVPKCHSQTYHSFANLKDCKKFWMCSHERPLATDVSPGTMFHFDVHQTGAWDEAKCKNMIKVANIVCSTSKSYSEKRIKRRVPKQSVMKGTLSIEDGKEDTSRSKRSVQNFAENDGSSGAYNPLSLAILQFYDWDTCEPTCKSKSGPTDLPDLRNCRRYWTCTSIGTQPTNRVVSEGTMFHPISLVQDHMNKTTCDFFLREIYTCPPPFRREDVENPALNYMFENTEPYFLD